MLVTQDFMDDLTFIHAHPFFSVVFSFTFLAVFSLLQPGPSVPLSGKHMHHAFYCISVLLCIQNGDIYHWNNDMLFF